MFSLVKDTGLGDWLLDFFCRFHDLPQERTILECVIVVGAILKTVQQLDLVLFSLFEIEQTRCVVRS